MPDDLHVWKEDRDVNLGCFLFPVSPLPFPVLTAPGDNPGDGECQLSVWSGDRIPSMDEAP